MLRQLTTGLRAIVFFTVLLGLVYPLAVTGVGQTVFDDRADGSLARTGDTVVGSSLIGQGFTGPTYFHSRSSAAGDGYDATASAATNLGPTNEDLLESIEETAAAYRAENNLAAEVELPSDAVTSSASGLDPHISVENAHIQARRVAEVRQIPFAEVLRAIDDATDGRNLGFLGAPGVNVLELNRSLDAR